VPYGRNGVDPTGAVAARPYPAQMDFIKPWHLSSLLCVVLVLVLIGSLVYYTARFGSKRR
jgi:hypothetical protein